MPKVSKQSASHVDDHGPVEDRHEDVDGYTVTFVSFRQDIDATMMLKGLSGDSCQCPHCPRIAHPVGERGLCMTSDTLALVPSYTESGLRVASDTLALVCF
jgi:hypothetical protein